MSMSISMSMSMSMSMASPLSYRGRAKWPAHNEYVIFLHIIPTRIGWKIGKHTVSIAKQ